MSSRASTDVDWSLVGRISRNDVELMVLTPMTVAVKAEYIVAMRVQYDSYLQRPL